MAVYHEKGKYRAEIEHVEPVQSKNNFPQFRFDLQLDGMYENNGELAMDYDRGRFPPSIYLTFSQATLGTPEEPGWVAGVLSQLGFNGDFTDSEQFLGMMVDVYCDHKEGEKDTFEEWSFDLPKKRKAIQAEKKALRKLTNQFSKFFKQEETQPSTNGKPANEEPPFSKPDDNIPI